MMQAADSFTSFGKLTGAQSAQQLHKLADYPADTLYASESEEVRCMRTCLRYVPQSPL